MVRSLVTLGAFLVFGISLAGQSADAPAAAGSQGIAKRQPPMVTVRQVTFENVTQLSTADQEKIASDLRGRTYHGPEWTKEFDERVRNAWQEHGYFLVRASSKVEQINDDPKNQDVTVTTEVDEGPKFLVSDIQWSGITDFPVDDLNAAMPLKRWDVFDTAKVREGLQQLRNLYTSKGYLDFVPVPQTTIDEGKHTVILHLEIDPGEVYRVTNVQYVGGNPELRRKVEAKWPTRPGEAFDPAAIRKFFQDSGSLLPPYMSVEQSVEEHIDRKNHTVDLTVHLEPPTK